MWHTRDAPFMNVLEFTALVGMGSLVAGLLGSLTGLGGGVVLVPLLTLFFKVDIRYAIGASLVSVIATSSGAAAAYVKEGFSNIRIGMFLEIATTLGALTGAFLATIVPTTALAIIFGVVLLYSAYLSRKPRSHLERNLPPDKLATRLRMNGSFPDEQGIRHYNVQKRSHRLQLDVWGGRSLRAAGDRVGRSQGSGHGPGDEDPLQGLDHDQQFHDRRDCGGERRGVSGPGLH